MSTATQSRPGTDVTTPWWRAAGARLDWRRDIIYVGFVVVFLVFAVLLGDQGFLSTTNLLNILRQSAIITIIAVGMTYVIACAEIDLSVGSIAGLTSITAAMAISAWGLVPGVVAGLLVGVVVGAINGSLVAFLRIPSFLVTLAMLGIAAGVAQWVTASAPQPILDRTFTTVFGSGNIGRLPGLVIWSAAVVAVGAVGDGVVWHGESLPSVGGGATCSGPGPPRGR